VDFEDLDTFADSDILIYYTIIIIFLKRNTLNIYLRENKKIVFYIFLYIFIFFYMKNKLFYIFIKVINNNNAL